MSGVNGVSVEQASGLRRRASLALGAAVGGWLAGILGVAVWMQWVFPRTAQEATHVGEAVLALAALALAGDLAAILTGAASLRQPASDPFQRRGTAVAAVALGAVGLAGVLVVVLLGMMSLRCGQQFDACQAGWTRTG